MASAQSSGEPREHRSELFVRMLQENDDDKRAALRAEYIARLNEDAAAAAAAARKGRA